MRFLSSTIAIVLLATSLQAQELPPQRFGGTGPDPLPAGGSLRVTYTNGNRAGEEIEVTATDGDGTDSRTVSIQLNDNGVGSSEWTPPPGWGSVVLSFPDSADKAISIESADEKTALAPVLLHEMAAARRRDLH